MADKSKSDKERVEMMRAIARLSFIPEGRKFLAKMLKQAKKELKEEIDRHKDSEKTGETDKKQFFKKWKSMKTYFFDLNGIKDQNGIKWEPVKVKSNEGKDIIDMVLPKFIKKLSKYEVPHDLLQSEIIELPALDKAFKIGFTKKSETRVQGFIKEHEEEEKKGEEDFVIRDDSNILVITKKYNNLKKDEMYEKIKQIMQEHPDLIEDIFFYSHMILKPGVE